MKRNKQAVVQLSEQELNGVIWLAQQLGLSRQKAMRQAIGDAITIQIIQDGLSKSMPTSTEDEERSVKFNWIEEEGE